MSRLAEHNEVHLFSRDEAKHWTIKNRISKNFRVSFHVGDIRDSSRILQVTRHVNPNIIILAAALKQVDTCEKEPYESIQTNILGINNVVDAVLSQEHLLKNLETVLMVSTDKACAPTNVYGMCKAVSERIITSASLSSNRVKFLGVRYGNVLESRGSIIPLFRYQCENSDRITITHREMTRFIMTLTESINLIEAAIYGAKTGEIWLPKLNSMKILDLAEIFATRYGKIIEEIGIRPGEKLHEDLVSEPESIRVRIEGDYMKMSPSYFEADPNNKPFIFTSKDTLLDKIKLEEYLVGLKIFTKPLDQFLGLSIEEIRGNR
jgi:UDP-glucose 4-epimerase